MRKKMEKSVTRELRKAVQNKDIRKNITKITYEEDYASETAYYHIYFKEDTVKSLYDEEYIDMTSAKVYTNNPVKDINDWLEEIAYLPEWYGEEKHR